MTETILAIGLAAVGILLAASRNSVKIKKSFDVEVNTEPDQEADPKRKLKNKG